MASSVLFQYLEEEEKRKQNEKNQKLQNETEVEKKIRLERKEKETEEEKLYRKGRNRYLSVSGARASVQFSNAANMTPLEIQSQLDRLSFEEIREITRDYVTEIIKLSKNYSKREGLSPEDREQIIKMVHSIFNSFKEFDHQMETSKTIYDLDPTLFSENLSKFEELVEKNQNLDEFFSKKFLSSIKRLLRITSAIGTGDHEALDQERDKKNDQEVAPKIPDKSSRPQFSQSEPISLETPPELQYRSKFLPLFSRLLQIVVPGEELKLVTEEPKVEKVEEKKESPRNQIPEQKEERQSEEREQVSEKESEEKQDEENTSEKQPKDEENGGEYSDETEYDENGGYYDEEGNYVEGYYENSEENYYDENGGYYDEEGNYIEGYYENNEGSTTNREDSTSLKDAEEIPKEVEKKEEIKEEKNENSGLSMMEMIRKAKRNRPIFGSSIAPSKEEEKTPTSPPVVPPSPDRPRRPSPPPNRLASASAAETLFSPKVGGPHRPSSPFPFSPTLPRIAVLDRSSRDLLDIEEEDLANIGATKLLMSKNQIFQLPDSIKNMFKLLMLDLSHNRFTQFPPQIFSLISLHELLLFGNRIPSIPEGISSLTNLRNLNLAQNRMEKFPSNLETLVNLTSLNLSKNKIAVVPDSMISKLSASLVTLNLQQNLLKEIPKGVSSLTSLRNFKLSQNQISSFESGSNLESLTELDLSHNELKEVPSSFSTLTSISRLDLSRNQIKSLPSFSSQWKSLKELRLRENQIEELPEEIWKLELLQILDLTSNKIKQIPNSVGNLINLTDFLFGDNKINSLPIEMGDLKSLKTLNIFGNELKEIPKELLNCKELTNLHLGYNQLIELPQPSVPKTYQWSELEELVLSGNRFGRVPLGADLLSGMVNLRTLLLGNCAIADPVCSIANSKTLTQLDLSGNRLTCVPQEFDQLTELVRLDLGNNRIESLPKGIINGLYYLEELILISNPLVTKQDYDKEELLSLLDRGATVYFDVHPIQKNEKGEIESHSVSNPEFLEFDFSEMTGKRPNQEDSLLLEPNFFFEKNGSKIKMDLWGVFDGHAGSSASKFSVLQFPQVLKKQLEGGLSPLQALEKSFYVVNDLFKEQMDNHKVSQLERHCGSTGLVILVDRVGKKIFSSNVGDTRAVLCRGGKALRLSFDHKPSDEEDRINDLGGHVVGEVTRRINGVIAVSRSIGDFYMQPFVICDPFLAEYSIEKEDELLIIGCDGVWDEIEDQHAVDLVKTEMDLYKASVKLRDYSYLLTSEDNISVMVVRL